MDQKTNLIVLKTILEISPDRHLDYPIEAVHKKLPELTEEIIEGSINDLEKQRCFKMLRGDGTIMHLVVLPNAIGYLREMEEAESNRLESLKSKKEDKWAERRWSLLMYVLGIVSTLFTQWMKSKIFP